MKTRNLPLIVMSAVLFGTAACGDSLPAVSRFEHQGLVVEFKAACKEGDIWLEGSLYNATAKPIRIASASLPWEFDALGARFEAESSGKPLARKPFFPPVGKPGPFDLGAQERQTGSTPIGFLFPDMKALLAKKQTVTVKWKYWVSVTPEDAIVGAIDIKQDPCAHSDNRK